MPNVWIVSRTYRNAPSSTIVTATVPIAVNCIAGVAGEVRENLTQEEPQSAPVHGSSSLARRRAGCVRAPGARRAGASGRRRPDCGSRPRTVVPLRLMRCSSSMISVVFDGSRLPVGSSHSSIFGLPTSARAIAVRCCSPPESSLGNMRLLCESPTRSSARGTCRITSLGPRAGDLERERDVLPHRLVREQLEVLEHDADVAAQLRHPAAAQRVDANAVDDDFAAASGSSSRYSSLRS